MSRVLESTRQKSAVLVTPSVSTQPPQMAVDIERQIAERDKDKLVIKTMLSLYVERMVVHKEKTAEWLRHAVVNSPKSSVELLQILKTSRANSAISEHDMLGIADDLSMINLYANMNREQLGLKSRINYNAQDILKLVTDIFLELLTEKREQLSNNSSQNNTPVQVSLRGVVM